MSVLGEEGVSWAYLSLTDQSQGIQKGVTTRRDGASRTFKVRGLPPGTYKARVYVQGRGRSNNSLEVLRPVVVSDRDQKGLRLVVVEAAPKSSAKKRGGASSGKD